MTLQLQRSATLTLLEQALSQRRALRLEYHGRRRIVSPHALGVKNRRLMLLGYQASAETGGQVSPTASGPGWRNLFVDELDHVGFTDPASPFQSAANYNPAHPFNSIDRVIVAVPSPQRTRPHS
ncbi:MAG: WYL domain-containing protein [Acidimicrobiales bacterium]